MKKIRLLLTLLLTSCAPQIVPAAGAPAPYHSPTPGAAPVPNVIVILETPQPTSTPFLYVIQAGDTFSGLAQRFQISQDELQAANPGISPNSMPIGGTLLIPDPSASRAAAQTPTPEPVPIAQAFCRPSADSGLWCFALIQNVAPVPLGNVSAQISLLDKNGNELASQTAFAPLDFIPPGEALPVYTFFAAAPADAQPQTRLLSAVRLDGNDPRYLPAKLNHAAAEIGWDGLSARARGEVFLPPESKAAAQVWVAAVAYDKAGRLVGVRRWEGGAMQPGAALRFDFFVSSLGGEIDRLEFFVQAK